MRCESKIEEDVAVLRLHGGADQWELAPFAARLECCLAAGHWRAVLDLSDVPWLTSSMISLLIAEQRLAAERGGGVVLAGLRPVARRSIDLLGVDRVLRSAPTVAEAIEALPR